MDSENQYSRAKKQLLLTPGATVESVSRTFGLNENQKKALRSFQQAHTIQNKIDPKVVNRVLIKEYLSKYIKYTGMPSSISDVLKMVSIEEADIINADKAYARSFLNNQRKVIPVGRSIFKEDIINNFQEEEKEHANAQSPSQSQVNPVMRSALARLSVPRTRMPRLPYKVAQSDMKKVIQNAKASSGYETFNKVPGDCFQPEKVPLEVQYRFLSDVTRHHKAMMPDFERKFALFNIKEESAQVTTIPGKTVQERKNYLSKQIDIDMKTLDNHIQLYRELNVKDDSNSFWDKELSSNYHFGDIHNRLWPACDPPNTDVDLYCDESNESLKTCCNDPFIAAGEPIPHNMCQNCFHVTQNQDLPQHIQSEAHMDFIKSFSRGDPMQGISVSTEIDQMIQEVKKEELLQQARAFNEKNAIKVVRRGQMNYVQSPQGNYYLKQDLFSPTGTISLVGEENVKHFLQVQESGRFTTKEGQTVLKQANSCLPKERDSAIPIDEMNDYESQEEDVDAAVLGMKKYFFQEMKKHIVDGETGRNYQIVHDPDTRGKRLKEFAAIRPDIPLKKPSPAPGDKDPFMLT